MQDGQFSLPPVVFGDSIINTPNQSPSQRSPEYVPVDTPIYRPLVAPPGQGGLNNNPDLYDDIRIANQSGLTNWWNQLVNSWNDTQIGMGASDLMDGLVKKANLQTELNQLEADRLNGMNEDVYLNKKTQLLTKLNAAYNDISSARASMYEDEQDKRPVSKKYEQQSMLANLEGYDASIGEKIKYQLPTVLGSSGSLMLPGIIAAFGQKRVQQLAGRALSSFAVPGAGQLALGVGFLTTLGANLFTRNLETKAEVGGAFMEDYEMLKSLYMADKPYGYQLSEEEDNKLILDASKGAKQLYNKNMSLALSDTFQSMVFAGGFSRMLSRIRDINKTTRLATRVGEFYVGKKMEGFEEGLQYAFQQEKKLASLGIEDERNFFDSLYQDYKDVLGSMQFLGYTGNGMYADDEEFQASVNSGELLGGLFGGVTSATRIGKDLIGYRDVRKELATLNPSKVDTPVLKFKDDLYATFFGSKKSGVLGLLSQDADDRVFFFKEGLKSLSKTTTEEGKPLLTKEELNQELADIDKAYSIFSEINTSLDNIMSPFGKEISKKAAFYKKNFRKELFHNTMQLARMEPNVTATSNKAELSLVKLNELSRVKAKIAVLEERANSAVGNIKKYQEQELKKLKNQEKTLRETYKELERETPEIEIIDQVTEEALHKYYDNAETNFDYLEKRKALKKVKTWKDLERWAKGYEKTAPQSYFKEAEDITTEENKEFAEGLGERPDYTTLTEEDKAKRKKENEDILKRAGFTKSYLETLNEDALEEEARKALEELKNGITNMTEDNLLGIITSVENKDQLEIALSRPSVRAAFNRTGFSIDEDLGTLKAKALQRLLEIQEERRKNKQRIARPAGMETGGNLVSGRVKFVEDTRNTADYETEFKIKVVDGKRIASQIDVLNAIISSPVATEPEKEIARKLLSITKPEDVIEFKENWRPKKRGGNVYNSDGTINKANSIRKPGSFNASTNEVVIDLDFFGDEYVGNQTENGAPVIEATILHELIHKHTVTAVQSDPTLMSQVTALLNEARKHGTRDQYYGLENEFEFLTEAMTSPQFQRFLAGIAGGESRSLWHQFLSAVSNLLKSWFGVEINGTLLGDVLALTTGIIDSRGQAKSVNVIAISEGFKLDVENKINPIDATKDDAKDTLNKIYLELLNTLGELTTENQLQDVTVSVLDTFLKDALNRKDAEIKAAKQAKDEYVFQEIPFKKGNFVVISGHDIPYKITDFNEANVKVTNKEGTISVFVEDVKIVQFQGSEAEAVNFIETRDSSKKDFSDSGDLFKSVQSGFEMVNGKLVENTDPVEVRFQNFVQKLFGGNIANTPYRGLVVQDDDTVAGFPIPRTKATQEYLANGGRRGQVVVIVDKAGNPVKFDDNMVPSESGNYVVFNLETPDRIRSRSLEAIAENRGVTLDVAKRLRDFAAAQVAKVRDFASKGKPIFIDFTSVNPGVTKPKVTEEVEIQPIDNSNAIRISSLFNLLKTLDRTADKAKIQQIKDFLYFHVTGANPNTKVSGGQIKVDGVVVDNVTPEYVRENLVYLKSFKLLSLPNAYEVLDVQDGQLTIKDTYPSYTSYLQTISNLGSTVSASRYNGYVTYKVAEVLENKPKEDPTKITEVNKPKEEKNLFNEGGLFDSSIGDSLSELEAEKSNFKGIFAESLKTRKLTEADVTAMIEQALDNKGVAVKAFGERAVDILYKMATYSQVKRALDYLEAKSSTPEDYDHLYRLIEQKSETFDSSIEGSFSNELGLFNNKTTLDLVKSIDAGIHTYLRRTGVTTIIEATDDKNFLLNVLPIVKTNILQRLNQLLEERKESLKQTPSPWLEAQISSIEDKINKVTNNWDSIVNYYINGNSYVFSFSNDVQYKYDEEGNLIEVGDDRVNKEKGFDKVGNEIAPADGINKESKSLIRGLSKVKRDNGKPVVRPDGTYEKVTNSFNVPDLVNFSVTYNNLLKNLQGTSTIEDKFERLESLKNKFPEYQELLEILRGYYAKHLSGDVGAIMMIAKFNIDFSNPEIPVIQSLFSIENGKTTFKADEATRKNVKELKKQALDNFRNKSNFRVGTTLADIALNSRILDLPIDSREERRTFLRELGFEISDDTFADPAFNTVASKQILGYFKETIADLVSNGRLIKDPLNDLAKGMGGRTSGVSNRINAILDLESKHSETSPTLSMENPEGNTVYALSRPNFYSAVITAINDVKRYPTFQDLVADPHLEFLDKPFAKTSLILNSIFTLDSNKNYGMRRLVNNVPVTLSLQNMAGLRVEGAEGKNTTNLFIGDKIVADINQFLKTGAKEFTRAGDKNSAFGIKVSSYMGQGRLPISNIAVFKEGWGGKQLGDTMELYLKGEVIRMILGTQGELSNINKVSPKDKTKSLGDKPSLFFSLLSDATKAELKEVISSLPKLEPNSDALYNQAELIAKDFITRPETLRTIKNFFAVEVQKKADSLNKYGFTFSNPYWLDESLKIYDAGTILRAYIVNEFIVHIEQFKMFNGDIMFYSFKDGEAHKRSPAFGATGLIPVSDNSFVEAMNTNPLTNLQSKLLGVNNPYSTILKTVVFRESQPKSVYIDTWKTQLKERGASDEEVKRIVSEYEKGSKEADAQGWITMDYYRSFKISIGQWRVRQEKAYEKISRGEALTADEMQLFPPVKAQYAGPLKNTNYHVPAFHKFSLLPLLPSVIKGTALETLNERMIRNNVSYALMESGSKLGNTIKPGGTLESFYANNNRELKSATDPFENENFVFTQYLKEQVQIEPDAHEEVIYGTQFRKLLFQNIYSNGSVVSEKLANLEQKYADVVSELTAFHEDQLIEDLGVKLTDDGNFQVVDKIKLIDKVRKEIKRRKLNNSIKDFFELENGELKYPLDASINHQQVRTLILSMINNRLIRQTIKGDMLVQASGLGFEKLEKPTQADQLKYGTNGLRFYHLEGGKTRKMQVKVSLSGDFKNLLKAKWNGEIIGTRERLNQALKDDTWLNENSKSITMVGYRIPTQGLNSIEIMEVAEFLPEEAGGVLVVPTEIVTKAGSDFDIDKLSVFKPNIKKDGSYITRKAYKGTKKAAMENIDSKLQELISKRKSLEYYANLPQEIRSEFLSKLESELGTSKDNELGQISISMAELRQKIDDTQKRIDLISEELRTNLDHDALDDLTGLRAELKDYRLELAQELDEKENIRRNLIKETRPGDIRKSEELLDSLYETMAVGYKEANDAITAEIDSLISIRTEALEDIADYKGGLFNTIIELAEERLTDPEAFLELITPNSTDFVKPKIEAISSKTGVGKKPYLHTNNLTSSTQEEKFLAGIPNKKALGIAAVANVIAQIFNKKGTKLNKVFKTRGVFHPMVGDLSFSDRVLKNGVLKSEIISQMINAYVDVLNDDFVSKGNLSLDTAGNFFYLLHLGHDPNQLMDFFNHPVILKYVAELQKGKSLIRREIEKQYIREELEASEEFSGDSAEIDTVVNARAKQEAFFNAIDFTDDYLNSTFKKLKTGGITVAEKNTKFFSVENLSEAVGKKVEDINMFEKWAILSYYLNVTEESSQLLKLQQANNYDTSTSVNPLAGEIRDLYRYELERDGLFNDTHITEGTVIESFNKTGLTSTLLESLFPLTLNQEMRGSMIETIVMVKNPDTDKVVRTFINDWLQFIAFNFGTTASGRPVGEYGRSLIYLNQRGQSLANMVVEFKTDPKWAGLRSEFPIINNVRVEYAGPIISIGIYKEDDSTDYQNSVIEQFQNLADLQGDAYTDEQKAQASIFVKNLMFVGFVQSGINKSPISFSELIPNEFYAPMMAKAIENFNKLDQQSKSRYFTRFSGMFRAINTHIMQRPANTIPYWRFKDYNTPKLSGEGAQITTLDSSIGSSYPIKPGVEELFNENESLTNAVYEALGFKTNLEEVNHYTKVLPQDFDFTSFQRGNLNVSQYGDGLNVSSGENKFLENRYGKAIKGYVDTKSFPVIDSNKSAVETYDYLKSLGFTFKDDREEYEFYGKEGLNENPANAYDLFEDFRKSNPQVKGVTILNHIIGKENTKVDKFHVIYDAKSFYGSNQITPQQKQQAQQLYSRYLDTIFPNSKVKDILENRADGYRDLKQSFKDGILPYFSVGYYEEFGNTVQRVLVNINKAADLGSDIHHLFLVDNVDKLKKKGFDGATTKANLRTNGRFFTQSSRGIDSLRIKFPSATEEELQLMLKEDLKEDLILSPTQEYKDNFEVVVFSPEQIYILGSKQDVEGFKEFVNNQASTQQNQFDSSLNNQTQYQLPQGREIEEFVASEKTIRDLAARMSDRIGIPVRVESDRTKEYKGKLENGVAVINLAYATLDTPIHEILGHPIIRAIKNKSFYNNVENSSNFIDWVQNKADYRPAPFMEGIMSDEIYKEAYAKYGKEWESLNKPLPQLYQNLLKELEYGKGKEVLDRIKKDYNVKTERKFAGTTIDNLEKRKEKGFEYEEAELNGKKYFNKYIPSIKYTLEEQQEEAIVELLGMLTAEKLDKVKDGKLISLLKRLLKEMKAFMRSLIGQKEVEIDKLPDNVTLGDIADLLAYSNSKLILPGNEVIYTTPDNQQFKTYQEASNHISNLAKSVEEIDLDNINLSNFNMPDRFEIQEYDRTYIYEKRNGQWYEYLKGETFFKEEKVTEEYVKKGYINNINKLQEFIEKNKEYEQSKEIIEEWKKVNNIQYNPEEIYSRGQEFVSVVGAYSDFDVNLMMQNLLQHIEDNQKAGGEFTISAFTKPVDRKIGHLEGGGGKIKFKIYPQSKDIKWAANTDVLSGSVWDASKKVSKDKKSELLGVSYTKYPSLRNVNTVQPNLAAIIDDLSHYHNELGISLTGSNFRLEYDENIPYSTKKIIDGINKILDQKYGKLVEPDIYKGGTKETTYAESFEEAKSLEEIGFKKNGTNEDGLPIYERIGYGTKEVKQPTQTNETLKESIESVSEKIGKDVYHIQLNSGLNKYVIYGSMGVRAFNENFNSEKEAQDFLDRKYPKKEYTEQALTNLKIAKLKEVAKKYPRSLIRSEVRSINSSSNLGFAGDELPFQKVSDNSFQQFQQSLNDPNTNPNQLPQGRGLEEFTATENQEIQNGTFEALVRNLYENGIINKICE